MSAYCQIYTPNVRRNAQKPQRVAQTAMDETKKVTQSRSSIGHLISPLHRHDHLAVPRRSGPSSVWLEIRRAQGLIEENDIPDPEDDTMKICEIDVDMIDDPAENKMPWIIFHFDFNSTNANLSPTSTCSEMSATSLSPVAAGSIGSSLDSDEGSYPQRTRLQRKQAAAGSSGPVEKKAPRTLQTARARALPIPKSLKSIQRSTQASLPVPIITSSPIKEHPSGPQPQAGLKRRRGSISSLSSSPSERPSVSPIDESLSDLESQLEALNKEESELLKKFKKKISDKQKKVDKLRRLV